MISYKQLNRLYELSTYIKLTNSERSEYDQLLKLYADSDNAISDDAPKEVIERFEIQLDIRLIEIQKDILKWVHEKAHPKYRRFLREDDYVKSFEERGEQVPPFLVFQPFEIREGVKGYLVPCKPDHPDAEET